MHLLRILLVVGGISSTVLECTQSHERCVLFLTRSLIQLDSLPDGTVTIIDITKWLVLQSRQRAHRRNQVLHAPSVDHWHNFRRGSDAREGAVVSLKTLERCEHLVALPITPRSTVTKDGVHDECALCLDLLEEGAMGLKLPCGHLFHAECIMKWFKTPYPSRCPLCKADPVVMPPGRMVVQPRGLARTDANQRFTGVALQPSGDAISYDLETFRDHRPDHWPIELVVVDNLVHVVRSTVQAFAWGQRSESALDVEEALRQESRGNFGHCQEALHQSSAASAAGNIDGVRNHNHTVANDRETNYGTSNQSVSTTSASETPAETSMCGTSTVRLTEGSVLGEIENPVETPRQRWNPLSC